MIDKFRVIIPAGGASSRSGLTYPKTLYKLDGLPILIRIFTIIENYDKRPVIIINPTHQNLFEQVLNEYGKQAELVIQPHPIGMGDAILQSDDKIDNDANIILIWSDIPLLSSITLKHLVDCHTVSQNNFSLITSLGENCYTMVQREKGQLLSVKETRALGIKAAKEGERDIGVFVFQKQPTFELLKRDANQEYLVGKKEHGFLYIIEKLVNKKMKVEGYPLALAKDVLSFNAPEDLEQIKKSI
jgi:bifunctional UDP-N-acetylglucosamine pyrophosphorylase/glucosamine-1-phosphate N-acetyltransferase